jgi:hypothetical protein
VGAPIISLFEYFAFKLRFSCRRHTFYIPARVQVVPDKAVMAHSAGVGEYRYSSTKSSFLISAINVGGWSTLRVGRFINLIRSSVGLRAVRDGFQRSLAPSAIGIPDEPRRSKSLYRLSYLGSSLRNNTPRFNTSHLFSLQLPTTGLDLGKIYRYHEQWNQSKV